MFIDCIQFRLMDQLAHNAVCNLDMIRLPVVWVTVLGLFYLVWLYTLLLQQVPDWRYPLKWLYNKRNMVTEAHPKVSWHFSKEKLEQKHKYNSIN